MQAPLAIMEILQVINKEGVTLPRPLAQGVVFEPRAASRWCTFLPSIEVTYNSSGIRAPIALFPRGPRYRAWPLALTQLCPW